MNREQYLDMRKNNSINIGLMYNYYVSKCQKNPIHSSIFRQVFPMYFNSNSDAIMQKLDTEFNITLLMNKQGETIDVW